MQHIPTDCLPSYRGKARYFLIEPTTGEAFGVYSGGRVIRCHPQTRRQLIAVLQVRRAVREMMEGATV